MADNRFRIPIQPTADKGPRRLRELPGRAWLRAARRTATGFNDDNLSDWAGALTYYGILSIFPGLLLMVTVLRLAGPGTTRTVLENVSAMAPGTVREILNAAADSLAHSRQGVTGLNAIVSLVGALWSASGYVGAFMRASNSIFDVPEGRPLWKKLPIRIGLTLLTSLFPFLIFVAALAGFFGSYDLAHEAANLIFAEWPDVVARPIAEEVQRVLTTPRSGGLLTFGAVFSFYFASSAIEALRVGLNRAYGLVEPRPWWMLRLQSLGLVLTGSFALLALAFLVVLGPLIVGRAVTGSRLGPRSKASRLPRGSSSKNDSRISATGSKARMCRGRTRGAVIRLCRSGSSFGKGKRTACTIASSTAVNPAGGEFDGCSPRVEPR